jgi:hypothetical protein
MNSTNLKDLGFQEWYPLNDLSPANIPYGKSGVFVIVDKTLTEPSDIIYIGRSKALTKKIIGGVLGGCGGKVAQKIHKQLFQNGLISNMQISWILVDKPKAKQQELLFKYEGEHGNYPAWNK